MSKQKKQEVAKACRVLNKAPTVLGLVRTGEAGAHYLLIDKSASYTLSIFLNTSHYTDNFFWQANIPSVS
jgi:hypothetical protein